VLLEPADCGSPGCSYITGQLFDQYYAPVEVEGIAVGLYVNAVEWQTVYTNAGGGIEATICADHDDLYLGNNEILAVDEGDCYGGYVDVGMVEPDLTELELVAVEPIMVPFYPGDVQMYEVICYNQNGDEMCYNSACCGATFNVGNDSVASWDIGYTYDGLDRRIRNNLTANAIGSTTVNVTCDDVASDDIDLMVIDPCDGVICDDIICIDGNCWNMTCEDGECVVYEERDKKKYINLLSEYIREFVESKLQEYA